MKRGMALFVDDVLTQRWTPMIPGITAESLYRAYERDGKSRIDQAAVFEISNVAAYFYKGTPQEEWGVLEDFPRPVPPFQFTWFEWNVPDQLLSGKTVRHSPVFDVGRKAGCLVACNGSDDAMKEAFPHVSFLVSMHSFIKGSSNIVDCPIMTFGLNDAFEPMGLFGRDGVDYYFAGADQTEASKRSSELQECANLALCLNHVSLLAISMLNCKNVVYRTAAFSPALQKSHARKGHPLKKVSYKVVEIQPITTIMQKRTGQSGYSRAAAAIIRGHFKDYRQGNGLFGKLKSLFWWEQRLAERRPGVEYRLKHAIGELDRNWRNPTVHRPT